MSNSENFTKNLCVKKETLLCNKLEKSLQKKIQSNSGIIAQNVIVCNKEQCMEDIEEKIKQGYEAMGSLNLEISQYGYEKDYNDLLEYEARL